MLKQNSIVHGSIAAAELWSLGSCKDPENPCPGVPLLTPRAPLLDPVNKLVIHKCQSTVGPQHNVFVHGPLGVVQGMPLLCYEIHGHILKQHASLPKSWRFYNSRITVKWLQMLQIFNKVSQYKIGMRNQQLSDWKKSIIWWYQLT